MIMRFIVIDVTITINLIIIVVIVIIIIDEIITLHDNFDYNLKIPLRVFTIKLFNK